MKRIAKLIFVSVAVSAFVMSCAKDELIETEQGGQVFYKEISASFPEGGNKTSLDEGGKVSWESGDIIFYLSYSSAKGGIVRKYEVEENCSTVHFTAQIDEGGSYLVAAYGAESIEAPYHMSALTMNGVVKAEQDGSFASAHASVGRVRLDNTNITMSNITSLVKFNIKDENVAYVKFSSNSGEYIHSSGKVLITYADKDLATEHESSLSSEGRGTTIKVNCNGKGTYYIALLPCTLSTGFSMELFDANNESLGKACLEKEIKFEKNKILNLGDVYPGKGDPTGAKNLSEKGKANCYIVNDLTTTNQYFFDATCMGPSDDPVGSTAETAEILWSTFNTNVTPGTESVVTNAYYKNGKIYFTALQNGNAVIALKDNEGKILWSWHIWVCEGYDPNSTAQKYRSGDQFMDRDLGALSNTATEEGDYSSNGLMYQWGRKDPFTGCFESSNVFLTATSSENGTIDYAVSNPDIFITSNVAPYDWLKIKNDDLWKWTSSIEKTKYDPCPSGWRVPDADSWSKNLGTSNFYHGFTYEGIDYGLLGKTASSDKTLGDCPHIWYQNAGYRDKASGMSKDRGRYGFWWSNSANDNYVNAFAMFYFTQVVYPTKSCVRANGASVRCVHIGDIKPTTVTGFELDKSEITLELYKKAKINVTNILPENATDKTIIWTSDPTDIVEVDQTGQVIAKKVGKCKIIATAKSDAEVYRECECEVTEAQVHDLSEGGCANCYIVSVPGSYKFKPTKGNADGAILTLSSAGTLWETFGNAVQPSVGSLIYDVSYKDGYVNFSVPEEMNNGNALIAGRDESGKILWSWHIWLCEDYDPVASSQEYRNGSGTMMDRNLGATSCTPGEVQTIGLLYQWGRKDPFLAGNGISSGTPAASTCGWSTKESTEKDGTIDFTVENPTTFLYSDEEKQNNRDWLYNSEDSNYNKRWLSTKTIYDPCPAGWKVPDGGSYGIWCNAYGKKTSQNGSRTINGPTTYTETIKGLYEAELAEPDSDITVSVSGEVLTVNIPKYVVNVVVNIKCYVPVKTITDELWDSSKMGMDMSDYFSENPDSQENSKIWYQATGYLVFKSGAIYGQGAYGMNWANNVEKETAYEFYYDSGDKYNMASALYRANGVAVRCQKDTE